MASKIDPLSFFDEPKQESFDAADKVSVNISRQQSSRFEAVKREVITAIMDQESCRWWMSDFLEKCNIFGNPLIPGDPYMTHANFGAMNTGKMMMADLMAIAPDQYVRMCKEKTAREESNRAALAKATATEK